MDNTTRLIILAAQNAGNGQAGIYSILAPAAVAGVFFIGIIILFGIISGILDHFTEKPDYYIPIWDEFPKDKEEVKRSDKKNVR